MKGLSICIPVYNFYVDALVKDLQQQLSAIDIPSEIVLIDDASGEAFRVENRKLEAENVRYIQLDSNIGRSKIRNLLAETAVYPYLIFMDCDSKLPSPYYIKEYIAYCHPMVVCYGGRIYEKNPPGDNTFLRWKYGVERESAPASIRNLNPNYGFCTNNFLIDRSVFESLKFDENLKGYGHEDTLFGLELLAKGIPITHIDNPLIHIGLEDAPVFLSKTRDSVANLLHINRMLKERYPAYINHSRLSISYEKLNRLRLRKLVALLFRWVERPLRKNLLGKKPSLKVFDVYRLGILSRH